MLVVFTLASLVVILCSSMRVESMSSANLTASVQAASIERGAEQYVLALLAEQKTSLSTLTNDYFAGVQVGDGYFWILRPNYGDKNLPPVGLSEEAAKLNINSATYDSLMRLSNMTDELALAILDWRGGSTSNGAQDSYYAGLPDPYSSKKGPFESVEELLLVQGASRQLLYGNGNGDPLGVNSNLGSGGAGGQAGADLANAYGLYDFLTVYSSETAATAQQINIADRIQTPQLQILLETKLGDKGRAAAIIASMRGDTFTDVFDFYFAVKLTPDEFSKIYDSITAAPVAATGGGGGGGKGSGGAAPARGAAAGAAAATPVKGRINVNTAPRDVLFCIPGLESSDVDSLISARQGSAAGDTTVAWVTGVLDQKKCHGLAARITGKTNQYSADILAVSGNGRGFKRVRMVIDASSTTPQIIYRRDLTDRGWPMDPQILASLRSGQGQVSGSGMSGGRTR